LADAQKDNAPGSTGGASDAISPIYGLRQVSALESLTGSGRGWRRGDGALTRRRCSGFSDRRP
jgi:hypothetical protein